MTTLKVQCISGPKIFKFEDDVVFCISALFPGILEFVAHNVSISLITKEKSNFNTKNVRKSGKTYAV